MELSASATIRRLVKEKYESIVRSKSKEEKPVAAPPAPPAPPPPAPAPKRDVRSNGPEVIRSVVPGGPSANVLREPMIDKRDIALKLFSYGGIPISPLRHFAIMLVKGPPRSGRTTFAYRSLISLGFNVIYAAEKTVGGLSHQAIDSSPRPNSRMKMWIPPDFTMQSIEETILRTNSLAVVIDSAETVFGANPETICSSVRRIASRISGFKLAIIVCENLPQEEELQADAIFEISDMRWRYVKSKYNNGFAKEGRV